MGQYSFKCNDEVVCIDPSLVKWLTKGRIYLVHQVDSHGMVIIRDDKDRIFPCSPTRFIKVDPE